MSKQIAMIAGLGLLGSAIILMPEIIKDMPFYARAWVFIMLFAGFLIGYGSTMQARS